MGGSVEAAGAAVAASKGRKVLSESEIDNEQQSQEDHRGNEQCAVGYRTITALNNPFATVWAVISHVRNLRAAIGTGDRVDFVALAEKVALLGPFRILKGFLYLPRQFVQPIAFVLARHGFSAQSVTGV